MNRVVTLLVPALAVGLLPACRSDNVFQRLDPTWSRMQVQPRAGAYSESTVFDDGEAMRTPPAGTLPYSVAPRDEPLTNGTSGGAYLQTFPLPVTLELVQRGRQQFEIVCATCHGMDGGGDSTAARFMARKPPSLHEDRVRVLPPGHLYQVIRDGYGLMPGYGTHFDVRDRWAVASYVRALGRAQHVIAAHLPQPLANELAKAAP